MKTVPGLVRLLATVALALPAPGAVLSAQTQNFANYTGLQGLPQAQVLALYQDGRGFLWIGTYGGLTRFDGVAFTTYTQRDGLGANTVTAIAEDGRGRLLVGTTGGGLCTFAPPAVSCRGTGDGLPDADVTALETESSGAVWVGTDGGLALIRPDGSIRAYSERDGLPSGVIGSIAKDERGTVWVGTGRGLAWFDGQRFRVLAGAEIEGHPIGFLVRLPSALTVGVGDRAYAVRSGRLEPLFGSLTAGNHLTGAAESPDGHLWLTSRTGVLSVRPRVAVYTVESGLPDNVVNTALVDRDGSAWFGTEAGLSRLSPGPFTNLTARDGIPHPFVRTLAEDSTGNLWVGTRDGVARRRQDRFEPLPLRGVPDRRVYALAHLAGGRTLIGTGRGLVDYRGGVRRIFGTADGLPDAWVTALLADGGGGAWVGTAQGLARWRDGALVANHDSSLSGTYVASLARDGRGRLWVGKRTGGIAILDGDRVTSLGPEQGMSRLPVWSIAADGNGAMWVGTNGDGVYRVAADGHITRLTSADGLVNDFVWQARPDRRGGVWLFTSFGLDRYQDGRFVHYGRDEGLVDLEGAAGAAWQDRQGDLWFGTGLGLLRYQADLDRVRDSRPEVFLEEMSAGPRRIGLTDAVVPPDTRNIRIHYTTPVFRNATQVRFRYRLDAGDWSPPIGERTLTFARLEPGRYALEVEAITAAGSTSGRPARLAFRVMPAWWQTWWFRLAALAMLCCLGASLPWLRSAHLRRANRRLEQQVAQHTAALADQNQRLAREVAERKAAEEALRDKEQRLRDILEHSTNYFYAQAADRSFTYLSPNAVEFLGIDLGRRQGHAEDILTDHPDNAEGRAIATRAVATGQPPPPYEIEIWSGKRERRWVEVNEAPVVRDGSTVAIVGSLTDITESRHARESKEQLEAQLRQAQKMEAVGRLAGGIAHDFNNLLTAIVGHTEFAAEAVAGTPAEADLAIIRRAADRATTLVSQLLAFSRQQVVKRQTIDLNVVAAEGSRMLERVLGSDIELVLDLAPTATWISADGTQLDQVLLNLAVNSRDAMPRGGRLTIRIRRRAVTEALASDVPAGQFAVLEVADSGHGIDPDTKARLFEPFFTTKEVGKGTGLGLAMVYGIVKQHGGHVVVASEPGRGASFQLYFPLAAEPVPEPAAVDPYPRPASGGADRVVLVVEDEDGIRDLVGSVLARRGYRVLSARDGATALEVSRQFAEPIDLLLTDMIMPGLNGRQVADRITDARRETRVLFMSGHADGTLGRNGLIEDESTELIRKPFTPSDLTRRVEEILAS